MNRIRLAPMRAADARVRRPEPRRGPAPRTLRLAGWLALAAAPFAALAQHTLDGRVIANGGTTTASGGGYTLDGTIAEPATGRATNVAGVELTAGFWQPRLVDRDDALFANGFED